MKVAKIKQIARSVRKRRPSSRRPDPIPSTSAAETEAPSATDSTDTTDTGITIITGLDELDEKLHEINEAWNVSDDAMRSVFTSFEMAYPDDMPSDPYSSDYSERVFDLYKVISGRDRYEVQNEHMDFPVDANRPFPFYTESPQTVGHQIMGIGFIITTMQLPPGSSVLELGAGWGNPTIALARMGYDLMAVDINETFADLIKERAQKLSLDVASVTGAFLEVDKLGRTFDAVLFYESFHHCSDHVELISKLAGVLNAGGKVFFAAEPITDAFPVPWGIRMDGESLWAMRQNGWLELGFQESYFVRTLLRLGWVATKHEEPVSFLTTVFEATRANGSYVMGTFLLPPDEDRSWAPRDEPGVELRFCTGTSRISIESRGGYHSIVIHVTNFAPRELSYSAKHGHQSVTGKVASGSDFDIELPYDPEATWLEVGSDTWRPSEVLGTTDERLIGLAIRTINLVRRADR
jgi:2-polyprenyl-3-methyl-5-hydroxy-6-metoxy-1,4-benzoquinol methylase